MLSFGAFDHDNARTRESEDTKTVRAVSIMATDMEILAKNNRVRFDL